MDGSYPLNTVVAGLGNSWKSWKGVRYFGRKARQSSDQLQPPFFCGSISAWTAVSAKLSGFVADVARLIGHVQQAGVNVFGVLLPCKRLAIGHVRIRHVYSIQKTFEKQSAVLISLYLTPHWKLMNDSWLQCDVWTSIVKDSAPCVCDLNMEPPIGDLQILSLWENPFS